MVGSRAYKNPVEIASMVDFAADMALKSLATSTSTSYNKVISEFKEYLSSLDESLCVFPASPIHIGIYMSHLFRRGMAVSTITTKLSALSFWHRIYWYEDPTAHYWVRRVLPQGRGNVCIQEHSDVPSNAIV